MPGVHWPVIAGTAIVSLAIVIGTLVRFAEGPAARATQRSADAAIPAVGTPVPAVAVPPDAAPRPDVAPSPDAAADATGREASTPSLDAGMMKRGRRSAAGKNGHASTTEPANLDVDRGD